MKKVSNLPLIIMVAFISFNASAQTIGDYRSNAATFNWNTDASWERWNGTSWVAPTAAQGYPGETAASIAGTVTIRTGHTVTANVDVTTNDLGNLALEGSGIMTMSNNTDIDVTGTLRLDGTSQIQGTSTSRTLDAAFFVVPATATNARITNIRFTITDPDFTTIPIAASILGSLNMSSTTATINGETLVSGTILLSNDTGTKNFNGKVTVSGSWTSTAIVTEGRLVFGGEVLTSGTFNPGCQDQ